MIWTQIVNPVIFNALGLQLRYNGFIYALTFILAYFIIKKEFKRNNINISRNNLVNIIIAVFCGGLTGARFFYVVLDYNYYWIESKYWYEVFMIWQGGFSLFGAISAGSLTIWLVYKFFGIRFDILFDIFALVFVLSQAIARVGNYINGDFYGIPTERNWGVIFEYGQAAYDYPGMALHPVMLYEAILNLTLFLILSYLKNLKFKFGFIASAYLFFYSIIRFIISFYTADDIFFYDYNTAQILSLTMFIFSLSLIIGFQLYQKPSQYRQKEYVPSRKWKL